MRHHSVLAHGLAVEAIRDRAPSDVKVGFAENLAVAVPAIDTPDAVRAAEAATRALDAPFMTVMLEGRYPDAYLDAAGADAPTFTDDELATISAPTDFVGINLYRPEVYVLPSDDPPGYRTIPLNASHPRMQSSWHLFGPEVMYWAPRFVRSLWKPSSIYITENGCGALDTVAPDGHVYDSDRVMFLRAYLHELQRATAENVPVDGYFLDRPGQLRVGRRLWHSVRHHLRGLRHPAAYPEAERRMVPRGSPPKRRSVDGSNRRQVHHDLEDVWNMSRR